MTDREKLLERLKKLFALGQSPNQHEAEAAMAKANEMMQEHQIGMTELDIQAEGGIEEEDLWVEGGRTGAKWITGLAMAAARLYDARGARATGANGNSGVTLRFFGTPTDVAAAKMTFTHLWESWKSIVDHDLRDARSGIASGMTKPWKNSHGRGFAAAINRRVEGLIAQRAAAVKSATGRDLVVVKGAALNDYLGDRIRTGSSSASKFHNGAFNTGTQRGNAIPLHGGIGDNRARAAIGKG